ncbi:hypothetical protein ACQP2F_18715 [Actinoplanes sp. CA-030573]|uniref:hypothetical protein n=1 Tax=Actinoplanes sp. CA-030573 TaxID=3239898 RepID=UPI003D8BCD83
MKRLLIALVPLLAAGCASPSDRGTAAAAAANRLLTAVAAKDGAGACAVLAPDTGAEVAQSADKPCSEAILDDDLPRPGRVLGTEVYGRRAQVRLDDDTVFLAVFPDGWRVVAAGCTPQGEKPYDCQVEAS